MNKINRISSKSLHLTILLMVLNTGTHLRQQRKKL